MKSMLKAYAQVEKEADLIKSKATRQQKHIPEIGPRPNYRKSEEVLESKMSSTSFDKSNSRKDSIKKEISTLKQKRQQLEKESSTISQEYMKDVLKKQLRGQHQIQEKDDILVNLEKAANETHKSYQKFRTDKLVTRIQYIISQNHNRHKKEFINILKHKHISILQLVKDFQEFRNYNKRKNILHQWRDIVQFEKQEQLLRQQQNEEQGQHKKNTIAVEFRNFCLLNRGFKGFVQYKRLNQYTKKFEVDQDNIKQKVNQFLNEMKVNVQQQIQQEREEIENIKQNINKQEVQYKQSETKDQQVIEKSHLQQEQIKQQKQFNNHNPQESQLLNSNLSQEEDLSISKSNPAFQQVQQQFYNNKKNFSHSENEYDDNEFLDESLQDELEQSIQLSIQPQAQPYMNFQNEQEEEKAKQPKNPWKQEIQSNQSQSGQKVQNNNEQQRPKSRQKSVKLAKEFEEKAQQRKARQEEIKKKYEEKKKQQELEKQQQELLKQQEIQRKKEEEYNRLQQKKQREKELKDQKEREQFEMNYKIELATKHHEKALQKFYIFIPLIKNYRLQFQQEDRAYDFYIQQSRRKIITYLKTAWTLQNEQRTYEENLNTISANTMYKNRCRGKIFHFIKTYFKVQKERQTYALSVRNEYLKRNVLTAWYIQLPNLQSENLKLERNQNQLVIEFRKVFIYSNLRHNYLEITLLHGKLSQEIKLLIKQKSKIKIKCGLKSTNGSLNSIQNKNDIFIIIMDFFDELFEKIPDKKVKQEQHQKPQQPQQQQKTQKEKPKIQQKQQIKQNQKNQDYPQFTEEQQLSNAINKLDLVTLSKENLYQQLPESKTSMQFEMDRYKFLLQTLIGDDNLINEKLDQKGFLLSKFEKPFQLKNQVEQQQTPIKNNFQRQLKVFKKKLKDVTYASVFPMHQLWKLYISDLISKEKVQESIYLRLLKADFHGALIMVYKAKCTSQEGIEGIVIQERLKTFLIITEQNKLLTLPKEQIVFLINVDGKYYKVQGQQIIFRPSDRAKIKFKYH